MDHIKIISHLITEDIDQNNSFDELYRLYGYPPYVKLNNAAQYMVSDDKIIFIIYDQLGNKHRGYMHWSKFEPYYTQYFKPFLTRDNLDIFRNHWDSHYAKFDVNYLGDNSEMVYQSPHVMYVGDEDGHVYKDSQGNRSVSGDGVHVFKSPHVRYVGDEDGHVYKDSQGNRSVYGDGTA